MDWDENKMVSKYIPLNQSNIGICFTASGYHNFSNFAALFGIPATYISDDEDETHEANTQSATDNNHEITTLQLPGLPPPLTEVCQLLEVSWQMSHAWIAHWTVASDTLTMSRRRSTRDERTYGRNAREPLLART